MTVVPESAVTATIQETVGFDGSPLAFGEPDMVLIRVERPGLWVACVWLSPHDGRLLGLTVPPDPEQE